MQGVETKNPPASVEQLKQQIADLNRDVLYWKFRVQSRQRTCGEILKRLFTLLSVIFFVLFLLYTGIYTLMTHTTVAAGVAATTPPQQCAAVVAPLPEESHFALHVRIMQKCHSQYRYALSGGSLRIFALLGCTQECNTAFIIHNNDPNA